MGKASHFLGIRFQWRETPDKVSVHMSQEAFADQLISNSGLDNDSASSKPTPFRSGLPVDCRFHSTHKTPSRAIIQSQATTTILCRLPQLARTSNTSRFSCNYKSSCTTTKQTLPWTHRCSKTRSKIPQEFKIPGYFVPQ